MISGLWKSTEEILHMASSGDTKGLQDFMQFVETGSNGVINCVRVVPAA